MGNDPAPKPAPAGSTTLWSVAANPLSLWIAFLLVHILIGFLGLHSVGMPLGDVFLVYKPWAQLAGQGTAVVGIDTDWVYPIFAIVPIMLPLVLGPENYTGAWLTMVLLLDAAAFAVLIIGRDPRRIKAAWWWLAFLALLGPIAVGRLDAVSVALSIIGLLWLTLNERVAVVVLTLATWIKVWPAALIAAAIIGFKSRWRILTAAAATSLVIVIVALTFGSGMHVLSFITMQTGQGLQIEAPVSTIWMWQAAAKVPGSFVYYDRDLLTFQVTGSGTATASSLMSPLLAIAVAVVVLIGVRAVRRGAPVTRILPELSLGFVAAFIAFNKVGSPQYVAWLAAPVLIGLVYQGRGFRAPTILVTVTAALTQIIYPFFYDYVLSVQPAILVVLTARNLMFFVILGWAMVALWRGAHPSDSELDTLPQKVWPFKAEPVAQDA
ncbi:glycosyltransferase 87 family protein [Leifsonia poae]|uniref:glycosyltransferase 87 family protein n=1 Tax=Leifsonia poae TaxID=110933 RepID=UPI003D670385